jgi:phospholipid/cholesterol/gamma-HCH transport system substrate-binding protein
LGEFVPSRKQLKWSQLKVGITVLAACITLAVLIFLMNSTGGVFVRKITLKAYFDNASGLRVGAPVRLDGVDIGNVYKIRIVAEKRLTPVEVTMRVNTKYKFNLRTDSVVTMSTAGVLGETFIDIDSARASGPEVKNGSELATEETPDIQDVVRSSQGTLQNMDALLRRLDRIVAFVESGQGSIGKLIYDAGLYNRLNSTVNEFQGLINEINQGNGTLGKLISDDELYRKANGTVDKLNTILDDLNAGKGTAGKFLKDPALYNTANETVANVKKLTDDINAGKGAIGVLARDQEFAAKLKNTMTKLSAITDRLDAGEGSAGRFLHDDTMYNNTNQLLVESRDLIAAIRKNPKKYLTIHLKLF